MKSWSDFQNFSTYRKPGMEKKNLRSNFTPEVVLWPFLPGASIRCQNWGCLNAYACHIRLRLKPNPKPSSPFSFLPLFLSQFHSFPLRFPCHSGFPYSSVKFSDPHPPSLLPVWTVPSLPTCIGTEPWPPVDGTGSFTRITPPPEKNF